MWIVESQFVDEENYNCATCITCCKDEAITAHNFTITKKNVVNARTHRQAKSEYHTMVNDMYYHCLGDHYHGSYLEFETLMKVKLSLINSYLDELNKVDNGHRKFTIDMYEKPLEGGANTYPK